MEEFVIKLKGVNFKCCCGCNVFHKKNNSEIYYCNSCESSYEFE